MSTESSTCEAPTRFVFRLGIHHFAHLRAIAQGLDLAHAAQRYLGIDHGNQARVASKQTADAARAIARRRGETAWRLIGLSIAVKTDGDKPTLDEFIDDRGLDGWSENEVAEMYQEAYPSSAKAEKRQRLRERLLELLRRLEALEAEQPLASDMVSGWFDSVTAAKLISAGFTTLGELNARISVGGHWYKTLPAVGRAKAQRIAAHLATLLPAEVGIRKPCFELADGQTPASTANESATQDSSVALPYPADTAASLHTSKSDAPMLSASSDMEAVQAWIQARAGSKITAKTYLREARRLLLWLQYERQGSQLADMRIEDCSAYMTFLQNIPPHWISRARAMPGEAGWAPFRGQLRHDSHRQAVVIVAALFTWLQAAQYLSGNPWVLVNKKTGDDRDHRKLDSKALSEVASNEILRFIDKQPPSPSRSRIRFILLFMSSVGLRSAELLIARLADLRLEPEGWVMQVHGKGAKNRIAAIPGQAFEALQSYLDARGLGGIEFAPTDAPLLASAKDPLKAVGYQALYEHVQGWLCKAVTASALSANDRLKLQGASTHWLRHTFGTRAMAREVPLDVIQAQMGHASIQTTANIYGRAPIKRRVDELGKAFE